MAGHMEGAAAVAHGLLERIDRHPSSGGEEHVLHIGTADPDLLTVRAARLIRMADVVVHDPAIDGVVLTSPDAMPSRSQWGTTATGGIRGSTKTGPAAA
jgi:hypothetical protein